MFLSRALQVLHTSARLVKHALVMLREECERRGSPPRCASSHRRGCARVNGQGSATWPCKLIFPCADCYSHAAKLTAGDRTRLRGCARRAELHARQGVVEQRRALFLKSRVRRIATCRRFIHFALVFQRGEHVENAGKGFSTLDSSPPAPLTARVRLQASETVTARRSEPLLLHLWDFGELRKSNASGQPYADIILLFYGFLLSVIVFDSQSSAAANCEVPQCSQLAAPATCRGCAWFT
ncbi:hypothetical protein AOLI_G00306480 [Acnodon oligacanthus]